MLHACLRAEQLLQNLAAVSGKPGLEAITEDQLIQASAMYHCSITQELKGGLINDQAAKAARKVAVQLRFSIPCAIGDTQASCRPHASEMWSPSYSCPPGPSSSRSLVHRGGLALGVEGKIYTCQYPRKCRRATIGRGHWRGDSVDSVASMSGGPTQAPADGEQVHSPGRSRGCKTCLHAQPGMLPVGKDQICSSDRTTGFLALESAYAEQQHLSWLCVLFLSSPKQVCAPSTQMGEAQEAEDEGASPRPRRYPRSRYRPDGTRRRTAGELRARGARNQWPPSTSHNKRGADNRPRGQQARERTQSLQPRAQANQWKHRGPRQDEHRDYGWRNWDSRSRDGQTGGQDRGRDRSRDRQPTHWGGRSSRPHYFGRADSARDRQPSQGYRGATHPATGRRTATPGSRSRQPSRSQHATGTTKAARLTAEETTPRAEPRQGNEKATGAVPVVQVVDEGAGAPEPHFGPFRPENGTEQASLEIQGRTGDPGPASHAESRVEATSAQARVPEKVGPG